MNGQQRVFKPKDTTASGKQAGIDQVGMAVPRYAPTLANDTKADFLVSKAHRVRRGLRMGLFASALLATLFVVWVGGSGAYRIFNQRDSELTANDDFRVVVERIISAESDGDPNKKNVRSSATGPGQFLDETWLEMIASYRPALVAGHSQKEVLKLRRDPELAREITTRLVQRNAKILSKRSLPVTPGTLYLAHFAGAAGAIAILSVPEGDHAASIMARADATGHMTREKIVFANPFLADFTVADLKRWADFKMKSSAR